MLASEDHRPLRLWFLILPPTYHPVKALLATPLPNPKAA